MGRLFGTDGVRGIAGEHPLTPSFVRRLGCEAARVLLEQRAVVLDGEAPLAVMCRDTRGSGTVLCRALAQGFARAGCRTMDLGVAPTPAASYLVPRLRAAAGVAVSASHNPPEFNGIKFFASSGAKAPESVEREIERRLSTSRDGGAGRLCGSYRKAPSALADYVDFLKSSFPAVLDLEGVRVVLDCANGAAYRMAPALLRGLGAEVFELGCSPDGGNINTGCGALATDRMRRETVRRRADCGISLDGDADRALLADEKGRLLDGDALIALSALYMRDRGLLRGGKVVVTVMSNLGLLRFLESEGIDTVQVPVGDRNVADAIERWGCVLGGENSGHLIFRHMAPTGDGMLTALQTLAAWRERGGRLSRLRSLYRSYPQLLRNLRVARRVPLDEVPGWHAFRRKAERRLRGDGRVFVRYSGTEPLLRILVEGAVRARVHGVSDDLVGFFRKVLGSIKR